MINLELKSLLGEEFEPVPDGFDYDTLTDAEMQGALTDIVSHMGAEGVLSFGDVYSILMEELHNDVLTLAATRRLEHE